MNCISSRLSFGIHPENFLLPTCFQLLFIHVSILLLQVTLEIDTYFVTLPQFPLVKNWKAKITDIFKTSRSMEHSANVSAWQNQLQMPFACSSAVCEQWWHLGLAGSPVTRGSPEISCPTKPRLCWELAKKAMLCKESGWDPVVALTDTWFGGIPEGEQKLSGQCSIYPHITA